MTDLNLIDQPKRIEQLEDERGINSINNRRLLEPIGNIPPIETEEAYYAQLEAMPTAA